MLLNLSGHIRTLSYAAAYCLFFVCCSTGSLAQKSFFPPGFGVEVNAIGGKIVKRDLQLNLPMPKASTGLEINLLWHTNGNKEWQQRSHYPILGVGMTYVDYGMDEVYGRCIGVYPNITLPLVKGKKIEWSIRAGEGIGYVTRKYGYFYPEKMNLVIGSHINGFFRGNSDLRFKVNRHWNIQTGINFTHISNAGVRKPNLGVNMLGAHVGVQYYPVSSTGNHIYTPLPALKNRYLFQLRSSVGLINSYIGGPLYPVYTGTAFVSKRLGGSDKVFAGIDYSYFGTIYAWLRNNELEYGNELAHSTKSGIVFGGEHMISRVGITLMGGVYIKQAYLPSYTKFYEKIGVSYYLVKEEKGFLKELSLGVFLKAHMHIAELVEVGVGTSF